MLVTDRQTDGQTAAITVCLGSSALGIKIAPQVLMPREISASWHTYVSDNTVNLPPSAAAMQVN